MYASLKRFPHCCLIIDIIIWRSISMRAGPTFLQFDWSRAGLSMDLQVFVYSHTKASFKFLSRQGRYMGQLFMWLQIFFFKPRRENLTGLLYCLDLVCQGPLIIEIVVSSPQAIRPTTLSFHLSVNMCF